jgi:hypothetical protein
MRGMWLCEGWAVPRWLATMVPTWVGSTGWNLVPAWYLLLYLLLLLRLLLRLLASRDSRATRHVCGLSPSSALLVAEKLVYSHLLTPDSNSGRNQPAAATAVQLQIAAQIK